jgi:hypothetical protein
MSQMFKGFNVPDVHGIENARMLLGFEMSRICNGKASFPVPVKPNRRMMLLKSSYSVSRCVMVMLCSFFIFSGQCDFHQKLETDAISSIFNVYTNLPGQ